MRPDGDCRDAHGADDDGQGPPRSGRRTGSGGRHHLDRRRRQTPPARNGARVRGIARLYPNSVKDDQAASYQRTSASLHRVRGHLVAERTALINQLRALRLAFAPGDAWYATPLPKWMGLGKVNRKELTLIADVLPMRYDLVIKRTLREAQGMLWANFAPSAQPSRCSSSQISPGPRTHATSASGVEARQRHRSLASRSAP